MGCTFIIPFGLSLHGFEQNCRWAESRGFRPLARVYIAGRLCAVFTGEDRQYFAYEEQYSAYKEMEAASRKQKASNSVAFLLAAAALCTSPRRIR